MMFAVDQRLRARAGLFVRWVHFYGGNGRARCGVKAQPVAKDPRLTESDRSRWRGCPECAVAITRES